MFANLSPTFPLLCCCFSFRSDFRFASTWHGCQTTGLNRVTSRYQPTDATLWSLAVLEMCVSARCVWKIMGACMTDILTNRGCGRQRHFQSYKCETCHSSLNGTAVCTQWTGHLRYCTVEDSAHLAFFFSIRRHTESGGTPVRLQTTGTALDTGML